ncbi:hypothetical protein WKY82_20405 [Gordonia malaquae]|uniref:hypothetical protein n=1 Tax=Gordonia malaquae TaxID=410332 RepID=UPI0030C79484
MIRRGPWVPLLPPKARFAVITIVPVILLGWGFDYVMPGETAESLSFVERAMPLWAWGVLCITAGILALTGFLGRWRRIAVVGLWLGGVTFFVLAVGQWVAVWNNPWLDGIRGPILASVVALAQLGMALGYALQPDADAIRREVEGD